MRFSPHNGDALRPQSVVNGLGDLRCQPLLYLQPFGVCLNHSCQF